MKKKGPEEFPIIKRDGRLYSFLDCTCDTDCKHRDCVYCSFEIEDVECPAYDGD